MELPPNPDNNPHLRGEIERGKEAPVRFEAGLTGNTVKAARIESKASAGEAAWAVMRGWSYPTYMAPQLHTADEPAPLYAKERLRPPPVEGMTFIGPVDYKHQMVFNDNKPLYQPNPPYNSGMRVYRLEPGMRPWRNPRFGSPDYAQPYDLIPTGEYTVRGRAFTVTQGGKTGDDLVLCTLQ